MNFDPQLLFGIASGIGLSAACGFRIFVPLLIGSIAHKLGWLPLAENLEWISSWPALIAFATASVLEIGAYYIPYLDNLLDTIAAPSAMIAGTIVSASTIINIDPTWQWILALLVGGGSAGIIQAGTGLTRLSSLKFTGGLGNHAVATGENVASIGGSIMAIIAPLIALTGVAILVIIILWMISKFFLKKSRESGIKSQEVI